ncbi:Uncharacterised protein [uncultured archaeon]|nr:Uncharacterised protein [uncultured archaeon]
MARPLSGISRLVDIVGNNKEDILEYVKVRRSDVYDKLAPLLDRDDLFFIAALAYAAGRTSVVAELEGKTIKEVEESR